jgi:hypothetical protein
MRCRSIVSASASAILALLALLALLAPLGCGLAAGASSDRAPPTSTGPADGTDAGTGATSAGFGDDAGGIATSCTVGPAPSGPNCACTYADCAGTIIDCSCAEPCWNATDASCLIDGNGGGTPTSTDPRLAGCTLDCRNVPATTGEFATPAHVECVATHCAAAPTNPPDAGSAGTPDAGACPVPVPGATIVSGPVWGEYNVHFRVPFASWAFAAAHASRRFSQLAAQGLRYRLSPSYFFANALKESYMGCSDKLPPYDAYHPGQLYQRTASYADGCFQMEATTAWVELTRLFPETIDGALESHDTVISATHQDTLGRDNFASSVFAASMYDVVSYAFLAEHGVASPDAWFASAADPLATVKLTALAYNEGWHSGDLDAAITGCHGQLIENCLGNKDYVVAVSSYTRDLESAVAAGDCYDEPISAADVDDYVAKITPLFVHQDAAAMKSAADAAFARVAAGRATVDFQAIAPAILDALDAVITTQLACPDAALSTWYGVHCPH